MLVVLDLLQGLDLPEGLVGDAVLQPPQSHFLQSHRLSCLSETTLIDRPTNYVYCVYCFSCACVYILCIYEYDMCIIHVHL